MMHNIMLQYQLFQHCMYIKKCCFEMFFWLLNYMLNTKLRDCSNTFSMNDDNYNKYLLNHNNVLDKHKLSLL